MTSRIERFWAAVMPEPNSGCWLWMRPLNGQGYGTFHSNTDCSKAHRWSYQHFKGPIPPGLQLDHKCRVRCCVNPDHLEIVTSRENTLRGFGPTAANAKKTHCKHGHEFTPQNIYWDSSGNRECVTCRAVRCAIRCAVRKAQRIARKEAHVS